MLPLLPGNHPLTRSCWLWPHGSIYLQNCHAQFRHDFELKTVPGTAPFFITADQSYRLYVNGAYVCRGPARGYQSHWPYDEIDLAPYLRPGHNFISAEAYNPGIGTFQYLHLYEAGFLCAAEWDGTGVQIHSNKQTWRMRRAPGSNPHVAMLSRQMAFQEDFDASKDGLEWITSPEPPVWTEDEMFRWQGEIPFGHLPWQTLEERGIPMLREEIRLPVRISAHAAGRMEDGYRSCFNIAWQWRKNEVKSIREWQSGGTVRSAVSGDRFEFTAEPTEPHEFRAITIEFETIQCGCLILEASNCTGREIVDCHYHQSLENGVPRKLIPVGNGGFLALATRLRTAKGSCGRMFYPVFGARHITFVFRDVTQPLTIRTAWRTAVYPFSMRGEFRTADPVLNGIHEICRNTQQICSTDAYMDTPWREQGQWWGDARIQARNTFYLDGDPRLLSRGILSIAGQDAPFGLTYGVAPCCNGGCILPDFSLTWILTIYDCYFQTGSLELFREQHDRIRRIFAYFESLSNDGIIRADPRFWLFEDWADLPRTGYPAFLNLWHLYTLMHYEKLLRAAGLDAEPVSRRCDELKQRLTEFFFDEAEGLFLPGKNPDGTVAVPFSIHDQVLAILTGLCPAHHRNMAEKCLLPFLRGEETPFAAPTSFWCTYLFEAAQQLGCRREVLPFLREHWGRMIPCGGTWEHLEWNEEDGQSCCHAWSSHPATHLPNLLLGLRQLAPVWREAECSPDPSLLTESGRILLPLPPGDLIAEWANDTIVFRVPSGMMLRVYNQTIAGGKREFRLSRQDQPG